MPDLELNKICDECGSHCVPIPCSNRLEASEFFCIKCSKSYRMSIESARYILTAEARARGK